MTTERRVRWGIYPTGRITHQFVQDFRDVRNGEVVAVAARRKAAAEAFAARYGIPFAHGSYEELLADPGVDAVYIATPHSLHAHNTTDAIRAGKHVLCEKPFTVSVAESQAVFEVARRHSSFVMEGMWTYFLPAIRQALEWVAEGRIGTLRQVKADFGYPLLPFDPLRREYDARVGGGCLLEMGIYPVALAWLFTGMDPARVQAVAHRAPNGVEDDVSMLFDYGDGDGAGAVLGTSFRAKLRNAAYVIGEDAYIAIPDFWRASECALFRLDERVDSFSDGRRGFGFNFEAESAGADILDGRRESDVMPWRTTLRLQAHMSQIRDAF
jgi:predicted dehydrogenase